jgi:hypothetical protein
MRNDKTYSEWIGHQVSKTALIPKNKTPKPFKSGLIKNTVKDTVTNPNTTRLAFMFEEDDSIVDCHICELTNN